MPQTDFDIHLTGIKVFLPDGGELFSVANFLVPHGSHILIQGASGSGKTTLLHLMAGLFSPQEGRVDIGHIQLNTITDDERCHFRMENIGIIFQKLNLMDHLTVFENVSLSIAAPLNKNADRIQSAVKKVNLQGREGDRCSFLSLGEQQRVAVARVLAQAPQIILADEPTSSLDEKNSSFVMDSLKKAADGKTLVVVSHDKRIADQFEKVIDFEDFTR